ASATPRLCGYLALPEGNAQRKLEGRSVSSLRTQRLPECINLLSIVRLSHPPALKQRRSREDVPVYIQSFDIAHHIVIYKVFIQGTVFNSTVFGISN
ncbi:hypothetical protein STEG23_037694, partial [Scotinomys teguina]